MQVTREVVVDLIPVYLSGEASAATKSLVEEYMRDHPDFADELRTNWSQSSRPESLPPDLEMRTLRRTRNLVTLRSWLLGFAIFCTLLPGTFMTAYGQRYSFADSFPAATIGVAVAAPICWIAWFVGRHLKVT